MAEGLKLKIGADVGEALQGMTAVEQRSLVLQKSIARLQAIISNTRSPQQLSSALAALSQRQAELNRITAAAPQTLNTLTRSSGQATLALTNLGRVAQDAPFGFLGIANNLNPLLESFQRLKATTGTTGGALKALGKELTGAGGIGFALSVASSLAIVFGDRLFGAGKAAKEAKSEADKLRDSINGIFQASAKEASQATGFVAILKSETETRQRKLEAIKELQQIQPEIFNNLRLEGDAVIGLDNAYKAYLENLKTVIAAKIKQAQLEQLIEKQLKLQGVTLTSSQKELVEGTKRFREAYANDPRLDPAIASKIKKVYTDQELQSKATADSLANDIDGIIKDLTELSKGIDTKEIKVRPDKVTIDDQLANIIRLDKPIPVAATIDLQDVEILNSADLLKPIEDVTSNIGKSLQRLVTAPKINIAPDVIEGMKKAREELDRMLQDATFVASTISDAFGQAFEEIASGKNVFEALGGVLKQVVLDLIKAAIQALIFRAIISAIPGGAAGSAGFKFGLAALAGARAEGGPVTGNSSYLVGERGPEIFTPSVSGSIIPNNQIGSFSGRSQMATVRITGRLRGNDMILQNARTNRMQTRLG